MLRNIMKIIDRKDRHLMFFYSAIVFQKYRINNLENLIISIENLMELKNYKINVSNTRKKKI